MCVRTGVEQTCAKYRAMDSFNAQLATVSTGLPDLSDGRSESELGGSLAEITTGTFSINVHEFDSPYPVVAGGAITHT